MFDWNKYLIQERFRQSSRGSYDASGKDKRNPFDSDLGRVVFSSGLRRMHDKTQVFPLTSGDFVHTRLTHSIEVMNVAVSIAMNLCRHQNFKSYFGDTVDPLIIEQQICAIVRAAAIMHDVGNPPFGHFGEAAIQKFFTSSEGNAYLRSLTDEQMFYDFTQFDGNAQGFRIMTKLQYLGDLEGLNLTFATLAAYTKYPNYGSKVKGDYIGRKKHGVMFSEKEVFDRMVEACSLRRPDGRVMRHPLAFVVEAADSICYNCMDMEDGMAMGWFDLDQAISFIEEQVGKRLAKCNSQAYSEHCVEQGRFSLYKLLGIEESKMRDHTPRKQIVDFRVMLMQYFVNLATKNFLSHLEEIAAGDYGYELIEDDNYGVAQAVSKLCYSKMFTRKEIRESELTGEAIITGLLRVVLNHLFSTDPEYRKRMTTVISETRLGLIVHEASYAQGQKYDPKESLVDYDVINLPPYYRLKLALDWITGMTDKYAMEMYRTLTGR